MKFLSGNHFQFYLTDSKHNLFHSFVVILIKGIQALILIPFSFYLFFLGYSFADKTIEKYLPLMAAEKINLCSIQLPLFSLIRDIVFDRLGNWYEDALVWWAIVVGIPLMAMAISLFFINLFNLYYSIFSPYYNRTHCPFCQKPIKAEPTKARTNSKKPKNNS